MANGSTSNLRVWNLIPLLPKYVYFVMFACSTEPMFMKLEMWIEKKNQIYVTKNVDVV